MRFAGLQKNSTLDFPGVLCAVLFSPGCNYCCFYCQNAALLARPPLLDNDEIRAFLKKRAGLIDGVVFSGGEPTMQDGLAEWLGFAQALGYRVKLDTNGSRPGVLRALLGAGLVDFAAMDYKAPFSLYPKICGCGAAGVRQSMALLAASGIEYELRTTVAPGLGLAELEAMSAELPPGARWALQLCRYDGAPSPAEIKALAKALSAQAPGVFARC